MVTEKNNSDNRKSQLLEALERIDKANPVVEVKWSVEEVTPSYNTGSYYDEDIPEQSRRVSVYFHTEAEAKDWMNNHQADDGKFLAVRKHVAKEYKSIKWTSVRMKK